VVVVVALSIGVHRDGHPSTDAETTHLANEVRCPVCQGETAAQSNTPASIQIRDQIHQELVAGESPAHIIDGLVASYGPSILEKPPAHGIGLVVWVAPIIAVAVAVAGLALAFARWRPRRSRDVTDADRALVDQALQQGSGHG
jgi:cytochrome c-type biogenesis protein CcmH